MLVKCSFLSVNGAEVELREEEGTGILKELFSLQDAILEVPPVVKKIIVTNVCHR